jgi:GldM N-terminal domain
MKIKILFLLSAALFACTSGQKSVDDVSAEQKMNDSINAITLKNEGIYKLIEEKYAISPELSGDYKNSAFELKQRSDEILFFLHDLKLSMITMADGENSPAINGREIDIAKVSHLNSISVPSDFMIGKNEDGRGYDLKAIFESYISFLNEIVQNDQITKDRINGAIDFSDHKSTGTKKSEASQNWVNYTFKGKTLGQTINTLSVLQFETRKLESETLLFLVQNIPADN